MSLAGKRIIVTGAAGVLGAAVVHAALAQGASVAAVGHAKAPVFEGERVHALAGGDLADTDAAEAAVSGAVHALGALNGVVNAAGGFRFAKLAGGNLDAFDLLYRMNLRSAAAVSRAALAHLREGGRIVNVGSASALKAGAGVAAYTASKAGVLRLTESLADELKGRGINVNAVLPSIIDTPQNRRDMPDADFAQWAKPEALASVIVFLLSDAASAVTGALIPVVGRV
ncbi:MAG TPA: SDR family NAD(P)-dependent oxidoreductase [Rhodanobacteraceae bacterium]|nr:SDR family NAD(P)-dependent oxidoreductase [Rhodanobacteraceae bacterium]